MNKILKHLKYFGVGLLVIVTFAAMLTAVIIGIVYAIRYAKYSWPIPALLIVYALGKDFYLKVIKTP